MSVVHLAYSMATIEKLPLLDPSSVFGRGGFGELFPDPRDQTRCIKVLKTPLTGSAADAIIRLVNVLKWARPSDALTMTTRFAWPLEVFGTTDAVVGFTMPRSPTSTRFTLTAGRSSREQDLQAKFLMDDAYWNSRAISSPKPDFSTGDRIEIFLDLAYSVMVLHENGLTYGDISSNNVAIRAEATPGVFLFDADSIISASDRAAQPLVSPGWEVGDQLNPIEIDRARIALFGMRLFVEVPSARTDADSLQTIESLLGQAASQSFKSAVETGGEQDFDALLSAVRARREGRRAREAFDAAVESRFARWVIRESDHATNLPDRRLVDEAVHQLQVEQAIASLGGHKKRLRVARTKLARSNFELDIPPMISLPNPPTTDEALKELVFEAMFEEVANHLVSEGLGTLEQHSWTSRAVRRALIEGEAPQVQVTSGVGTASVRIWWPIDQFVNAAKLTISFPGGDSESELHRGDADSQMTREVTLPSGGPVSVQVRAGSVSPSGVTVWSDRTIDRHVEVSPIPRPTVAITSPRTIDPTPTASVATVYDPEAERQRLLLERLQREQEEEEARRARRRRAALIALGVICLALPAGWLGWQFIVEPQRSLDGVAGYVNRPYDSTPELQPPTDVANLTVRSDGRRIDLSWSPARTAAGTLPRRYEVAQIDLDTGKMTNFFAGANNKISLVDVPAGTYSFEVRPQWSSTLSGDPVSGPSVEISPASRRAPEFLPVGVVIGIDDSGPFIERETDDDNTYRAIWFTPEGQASEIDGLAAGRTAIGVGEPGTWSFKIGARDINGAVVVSLPRLIIPADHPSTNRTSTPMEAP